MNDTAAATLFLCGDVMTGRGIDQILPHPSQPGLYESYLHSALDYVLLAEAASGPVPRPAGFPYIWGDALAELELRAPQLRIVNLETAVTTSSAPCPKGINYRMHPANLPCLDAAGIDCCVLANNHVLDWGREGLAETLRTLEHAGIRTAGAGADLEAAQAPAVLGLRDGGRVLVFAAATGDCGVTRDWAAEPARAGVNLLPGLSAEVLQQIGRQVRRHKRPGDIAVYSVHWGGNWGYRIAAEQRQFAHGLIDGCAIDLVHGHSSHHVKAIEVHRERLILYGCGDLLNDYEGIGGHEEYCGGLGLMYFPRLDGAGRLLSLQMTAMRSRRLRLERAGVEDRRRLLEILQRECRGCGGDVEEAEDGTLLLRWR